MTAGGLSSIKTANLTKLFGAVRALKSVSLGAEAGEVVAVMGPNGAGKSTLLALISLTMRPTRGQVLFDGEPVRAADPAVRSRIGLLSHQPLVYPDLTGRENLRLFAKLHGVADPAAALAAAAERFALDAFVGDRPARVLSRGQLQRLALARALIASPDLLLLDEPAAGLDANAVGRIERALADHRERGGIALMVTHEPVLAAAVATRAVLIDRGRVIADEPAPAAADGWRELYATALTGSVR
jgi:heme exporter protein A